LRTTTVSNVITSPTNLLMLFATVATASKIVKVIPANIIGTCKKQKTNENKLFKTNFTAKKQQCLGEIAATL
jgi:hypothetical protein